MHLHVEETTSGELERLVHAQSPLFEIVREQIERLLAEFDRHDERLRDLPGAEGMVGGPIIYDTAAIRRELGLD